MKLQGGLGNQMFQYACGKALSLKHDQQLLVDDSFLAQNQTATDEFTPRHYELDAFELDTIKASGGLVKSFQKGSTGNKILKLLGLHYKKRVSEIPGNGAGQLDNIKFPVYLEGYWQSEQYFAGYADEIRKCFTFRNDTVESLSGMTSGSAATTPVSIHVRRGDYITNPVARKVLGTLDLDYYQRAIELIKQKVELPFFFIFSDEPEWVKENLKITGGYHIIGPQTQDKHWMDMQLMSKCAHHIIANSSFSWWGAWLNPDPQKIVVAPKRWFANDELNAASRNLVPANWIRI